MTTLTVHVHGTPKPKGSMRSLGRGRMIEQVAGSKEWRAAVVIAAAQERDRTAWETLDRVPVTVTIRFTVVRPKTVKNTEPITRGSGDVDKLARNILDALSDAWVIRDDSQVTRLEATKEYGDRAGAVITVTSTAEPTGQARQPLVSATSSDRLRSASQKRSAPTRVLTHSNRGLTEHLSEQERL
jgi:Holliday junction resolvase RusA-like endonuclease